MTARSIAACVMVLATSAGMAEQTSRDTVRPVPRGTALIAGTVVSAEPDRRPIRGARVILNHISFGVPGQTTTTDEAGRFAFSDIPAGQYRLQAGKPGLLPMSYGATRPAGSDVPITVSEGQQMTGLSIALVRGGVVTGTVVDDSGRGMPGAVVTVLRFGYNTSTGERTLSFTSAASTGDISDDRGVYRVWGMPPGDYVIMVESLEQANDSKAGLSEVRRLSTGDVDRAIALARAGRPVSGVGAAAELPVFPAGEPVQNAPTYHPGVVDLAQASTVSIGAGEERAGVDVPVRRIPAARIRGTVRVLDGMTPGDVAVELRIAGTAGEVLRSLSMRDTKVPVQPDGSFEFIGVVPGSYVVRSRPASPGLLGPVGSPSRSAWAQADVLVQGRDQIVTLELRPGMPVTGRIVFDGRTPPPADASGIQIQLTPYWSTSVSDGAPGGLTDRDGRFGFPAVMPDTYRLTSNRPSTIQAWTIRSAIANGRDALDHGLQIAPGEGVALTITFTDRPSELSGTLQTASGTLTPTYSIVVFTTDRSLWMPAARRVRMVRPGADGRYVVPDIPPGEYFIAALTDIEPGAWHDRAFLEALVPAAIRVTVGEGERKIQNIQIK